MSERSWSLKILTVRGVPIRIHATFLLLLLWVVSTNGGNTQEIFWEVIFTCTVFLCVLLHECGHVFMAQYFGIRSRDIVLYPFGGVASLMDRQTPVQEFFVTLAGPLVNVIIASGCYLLLPQAVSLEFDVASSFASALFRVNVGLFLFNMLPAFPMDGGRVLRSFLQILKVPYATAIAVRISQLICIGMIVVGVRYDALMLVIIGMIIFKGAKLELLMERGEKSFRPKRDEIIEVEAITKESGG